MSNKQQSSSKRSAIRPGFRSIGPSCAPATPACRSAACKNGWAFPPRRSPHHLQRLIATGLLTQERQATTLICRANYPAMNSLIGFLADECCADAASASSEEAAA
jgi:hypothetical protein